MIFMIISKERLTKVTSHLKFRLGSKEATSNRLFEKAATRFLSQLPQLFIIQLSMQPL